MLISSGGTLVRTPVGEISIQGRNTQGVRLIRVDEGDRLVGLERIVNDGTVGPDGGEAIEGGEGVEGGEVIEGGASDEPGAGGDAAPDVTPE
jgi:DNA gyrase subunit A